MSAENLADVARRRHESRQPVEREPRGVNALLSKLRIEQERQRQNVAVRAARSQIKDDKTHVRYLYTSSPRTSTAEPFAFHTDQVDPTSPPLPRRTTGRRRTPGPSAPASWTAPAPAPAAAAVEPDRALTRDEEADKRWRMWQGWCREVVEGFVGVEKMPFEVQRRRRSVWRREGEHGFDVVPLRGPPSLVNSTIRLLSRHMASSSSVNTGETSWLTSPDVKQFLGTEVRLSVMLHAVWDGGTTWRGVRDIAQGCMEHARTDAADDEETHDEEWDASSSPSESEPPPTIPHLPLLDFSFGSLPHPGTKDHRALTRYLATPDVRATVEGISFAGTSMGPREVVECLARGEGRPWGALRSVSLAGVRGGVEEWRSGLMKLARYAPGLEFLDLSGIECIPHQEGEWRTLLTTILDARGTTTKRYEYPSLRVLGFRDNHPPLSRARAGTTGRVDRKERELTGDGSSGDAMDVWEAEVKRLVRSFGRPRWVEVVVR